MIYNIYLNKIVKVFKLSVYILTGQIGSGKTEAVKIFKKLGFSCFCADEVVRELYKEKKVLLNINRIFHTSYYLQLLKKISALRNFQIV